MFQGARSFNQPLNKWNVSNETDMVWMFRNATSFNQPLNNWDVSNVEDMSYMFHGAESFNQPLNNCVPRTVNGTGHACSWWSLLCAQPWVTVLAIIARVFGCAACDGRALARWELGAGVSGVVTGGWALADC